MPGFDRTGPFGEGPMTGGGMGRCGRGRHWQGAGFGRGRGGRPFGGGRGRGWGGGGGQGRGWGRGYWGYDEDVAPETHESVLAERIDWLERELKHTREELERLKGK